MNDMLNSLEGFDSGSNYKFGDKLKVNKNPRSLFDLSHLSTLTIPNAGMLIPISTWECLPSDDFDIYVDALVRVMPQVVPLYSRQRLYVYAFYSRYSDLWNNWQVFIDKGYTGNVQKSIPVLKHGLNYLNTSDDYITADSLLDYFGLPIGADKADLFGDENGTSSIANISALDSMMFLRIYRDYFMNKNEWIEDRVLLPDDDSRFRLDDDGQLLSAKDLNKHFYFHSDTNYDLSIDANGNYFFSGAYHDYPDDYFTSALPFTQRGTSAKISKELDLSQISLDLSTQLAEEESKAMYLLGIDKDLNKLGAFKAVNTNTENTLYTGNNTFFTHAGDNPQTTTTGQTLLKNLFAGAKLSGSGLGFDITPEDIRKMMISQIEMEQLARTDGSYKQFGLSFFGESSKASYDFKPMYIGGTYKNISFTEVLQTSGSTVPTTAESGSSPLGAYAGHGITGISSGRIGHIHCDDYGMIMIIACIMPDIYYCQGLDRLHTDSLQSEKFMPERVKLGMQPIYNKELFYAGNNGSSEGDDNYLWAYQNPFDWLRYMPNRIHGKIADSSNKTFFPYTQARHFSQLPNWGREFSEANKVRKDYLFATSEDAYSAQFSINVRAVRPLPYKAIPAEIIN